MKKLYCRFVLLLLCSIGLSNHASATHIYGADFFYTHGSGLQYNITIVIYGDCGGSAISNLYGASPQVEIYNGSTLITTIGLSQVGTSTGVEVTPVCPSQLSNTNCVSSTGTVPGVKKFVYSASYTLSTTSANWKFRFTGSVSTTGGGSAGRSNSITNINTGSIMALEATLNNLSGPNSSPTYTTIPTPFFCINVPANYNPGTIDPDGNTLSYALVPGLAGSGGGSVSYISPYTATTPLASSSGSFSYSTSTGQLAFTPNLVQRSLVVNTVSEYNGSTLVGTSMREMTFVVIGSCSNNAPIGSMSTASAGSLNSAGTILTLCKYSGTLSFNINPTDVEGDTINMSVSGIPSGASFSISSNNTTAPTGSFSWDITGVAPGTYNFYITYTDNGCPLSSKQTLVYSIVILPNPAVTFTLLSPATCLKKAKFNLTPQVAPSPWSIDVLQGSTTIQSFPGLTGVKLDSLNPGTYTLHVTNANSCYKDTNITILSPPGIIPNLTMTQPSCYGFSDGNITLYAGGGTTPYSYAIGTGTYSSSSSFSGLSAGTYTMHIKDGSDCIKDTTVTLTEPAQISIALQVARPRCNYYNSGMVTVIASNGLSPFQYALGTGSYSTINSYTGLASGSYLFHVKDNNGCIRDSLFQLKDSIIVHGSAVVTDLLCNGANTGAINITGNGGNSPYLYKLGTGTLSTNNNFTNLVSNTYNIHVQDVDSCYLDTAISLVQPAAITSNSTIIKPTCKGFSNATIITLASGGTSPYTYAISSGLYSGTNTFSGLTAGTYTVHIKDAHNCVKDTIITITEPIQLVFNNIAIVEPICNSTPTGSITVTAGGGTSPYTYAMDANPFGSAFTYNNVSAGTYTMHIKDANSCVADSVITVTQPTRIVPSLAVKQSTCTPLNDGKVIVSVSGGVPSYQYALGSGSYSGANAFSSLPRGTYIFHIKDSRTCVKDTTLTISDSTAVTASYTISNVKCFTESTGYIIATALTGQSPYSYAINTNPFGSSGTFNSLYANTYTIHIKDALGCTKDTGITITEPTQLAPGVFITSPSCHGFANGAVFISGTGGTMPYSYSYGVLTYQSGNNFTGLAAGNYTFHVKDGNNCIHDTAITITQPASLVYDSLVLDDVLCFGTNSGKATIYASGGTVPYSYSADGSPFQTNPVLTGLAVGTHVIKVNDKNNCYRDSVIVLKQPTKLVFKTPDITYPTCEGYTDASVVLFADGGTKPYTYAIDSFAFTTDNSFKKLLQGSYRFHIKDKNDCQVDTTITLNGYPPIVITGLDITDVTCNDLSDGKISVDAAGGVPPFNYKLNGGTAINDNYFDKLKAGIYHIRVTDNKDCFKDTTTEITQPAKLVVSTTAIPNDCENYDDGGLVKADVTGGTFPYTYKWSYPNAGTSPEARGLPNGKYRVWVSDANVCSDSAVADVVYDNCCKVFIPNAFTPNGDGKNDYAHVLFKGDLKITVFMIYNRYGQKMFETSNVLDGWDGMHNGIPQELDTYNYYIKGICGNGGNKNVEYKGTIMLVR